MWIMLNDAFLSFVSKDCKPDELLVRARRPGDIEKIFTNAKVTEYDKSDYQFRAVVKRTAVEEALVGEVKRIVYNNFKNSVRDNDLHTAYNQVWSTMSRLQPKPPYSGLRGRFDDLLLDDFGLDTLKGAKKKRPAKKLTRGR